MKSDVDTRVVRMEFDNKQFEKNVKKSTKSINELKQTLDFKGVGESIDKVKVKFNALQIAATTVIAAITTKVVNLGITMVKSLSVDNIASGWAKYGEKTISVATMMAQKIRIAGEEITDLAKKTEVVNEQLEKLTWFSDETSYSFTDMTNYVGKFIAAGQDLDKSVKAMEGIATWAALSGQNAQVASRAMMQLAQAMGRSINRQDWSSIQTANMDTEEFREKVLETAVALGELTKEGDKFVTKTGKKFDKAGFLQYFSEGWFTSDVLVETLNKYSAAVDEIYEISIKEGLTATEVIEKYGDQFDEFAIKAFKAAQEARTFNDVINSVKDAVSSKWMTTFETIFGNKDESVKLWSKLANELYDAFAESGNFRNNVLAAWKEMGGREDIFGEDGAFWNLYYALKAIRDLIKEAWNTIFPLTEMEDENDQAKDIARTLKAITKQINDFTKKLILSEKASQRLSKIFRGLFSIIQVGVFALKAIRYVLDPILYTLKALANQTLNRILSLTGGIQKILDLIYNIATNLNAAIWDLLKVINPSKILDYIFNGISKIYKIITDLKPITNLINFIKELYQTLADNIDLSGIIEDSFELLDNVFKMVGSAILSVVNIFKELRPTLSNVSKLIISTISIVSKLVLSLLSLGVRLLNVIVDFINKSKIIERLSKVLTKVLIPLLNIAVSLFKVGLALIQNVFGKIIQFLDDISIKISGKTFIDSLSDLLNNFTDVAAKFFDNIGKLSGNDAHALSNGLSKLFEGILSVAKALIPILSVTFKVLGTLLEMVGVVLTDIFSKVLGILTNKDVKNFMVIAVRLAAIVAIAYMIYNIFWALKTILFPLQELVASVSDMFYAIADKLRVDAIQKIVKSLLIVAISLAIIASIDTKQLYHALNAIGIIAGIIVAFMYILNSFIGKTRKAKSLGAEFQKLVKNFGELMKIQQIASAVMRIAVAMFVIAGALKIISTINEEDLTRSLGVVIGIGAMIFGLISLSKRVSKKEAAQMEMSMKALSKALGVFGLAMTILAIDMSIIGKMDYGKAWSSLGIIIAALSSFILITALSKKVKKKSIMELIGAFAAFGAAMRILVADIAVLSGLDYGKAWSSLGIVIAAFSAFILITKFSKKVKPANMKALIGLFALFGLACRILADSIFIIGLLDPTQMWSSAGVIIAMLASFITIVALSNKVKPAKMKALIGLFTLFGLACKILASSIFTIGLLKPTQMWSSAGVMMAMLSAFIIIVALSNKVKPAKMKALIGLFTLFALACKILASSIFMIGLLDPTKVWTGAGAMIAMLASFIIIVNYSKKVKPAKMKALIGLFTLFGLACNIFAQDLFILSKLDTKKAWNGVAIIVALITFMTILSAVVGKKSEMIDAGAKSLTNLAGAVALLGIGILAAAAAIALLVSLGPAVGSFLEVLADSIVNVITLIITGLAAVVDKLVSFVLAIVEKIIVGITNIINNSLLPLAEALINLIIGVLQLIADKSQQIFELVGTIVINLVMFLLDLLINNIGTIIDKVVILVHTLLEALIQNLPTILNDIINLVVNLINILGEALASSSSLLTNALASFLMNVLKAVLNIFGVEASDEMMAEFKEIFSEIFKLVGEILVGVLDNIKQLLKAIDWKTITGLIVNVLQIISNILIALKPLISAIIDSVITIFNAIDWVQILTFIAQLFQVIADIIAWVTPIIADILGPVLKLIFNVLSAILTVVAPLLDILMTVLKPFLDGLVAIIELLANVLGTVLGPVLQTIFKFIGAIIESIMALFSGDFESLGQRLKDIWSNAFSGIASVWEGFGEKWHSWWDSFWEENKEKLKTVGIILLGILTGGLGLAVAAIIKYWDKIKEVIVNAFNTVKNFFKNKIEEFKNIGKNFILGILNGTKEGFDKIKSGLSKIGDGIKDYFKSMFGIHSPSTVFANYGEWMMKGLVVGLEDGLNNQKDKINNVCSQIMSDVEDVLNVDDEDLTLTVGLDLSGVEAGAAQAKDIVTSINTKIGSTAFGVNAGRVEADINGGKIKHDGTLANSGVTNNTNNNTTNNNVFNITAKNPKETAEEIDKILAESAKKAKLARGGI